MQTLPRMVRNVLLVKVYVVHIKDTLLGSTPNVVQAAQADLLHIKLSVFNPIYSSSDLF